MSNWKYFYKFGVIKILPATREGFENGLGMGDNLSAVIFTSMVQLGMELLRDISAFHTDNIQTSHRHKSTCAPRVFSHLD